MGWFSQNAPRGSSMAAVAAPPQTWAEQIRDKFDQAEADQSAPAAPAETQATAAAPQGFSWDRWNELTSQYPGTVAGLEQLVREHPELGVQIVGGSRGDIQLPNGETWDVMLSAGEGGKGWTRFQDTGGGTATGQRAGANTGLASGSLLQPWTEDFAHPQFKRPDPFKAPDAAQVFDDPGFQFRMNEGNKAIQRAAAAKGTVLTGGTLKALQRFNSDLASQEYGNVYNRRLGEYQLQGGNERGDFERDYNQALTQYGMRRGNFFDNQDRPFNKLTAMAGLGSVQSPNYAGQYGNLLMSGAQNLGNLYTQMGNAQAAGAAGAANAWGGFFGNAMGNGMDLASYYARPGGSSFLSQDPSARGSIPFNSPQWYGYGS
jgi:hypothetical protein